MCGIAGFIGNRQIDDERINFTLELMRNRGPDHRGYIAFRDCGTNVLLLNSRLSIIDLDPRANQPFVIGDYAVVFNGEIYNYLELRQALEKRGVAFRTSSDTEVLLQSYILYGHDCVKDFEGMWSFAVYDKKRNILFLSRDRFAEKPLYYMVKEDGIYFASEIKFIRSLLGEDIVINQAHLLRYLAMGYKSLYKTNETFFAGVRELPYATNMHIDNRLLPRFERYWRPAYAPQKMGLAEAVEGFRRRLIEAVAIRLRSDVPLAFCLSGGVDSGVITSIAKKVFAYDVAAFSIIDSGSRYYDESRNIRLTIDDLKCRHTEVRIRKENFFSSLSRLISYHDAPVYTITYYIHSLLSKAISENGYKVVLSGTGADELVTGYYDHFLLHLYEMRGHPDYPRLLNEWEGAVKGLVRNPCLSNPRLYFDDPGFRRHIYYDGDDFSWLMKADFRERFREENYSDSLLRNRMLNELFHETIPQILHEDDLNSMFYSLENRSPYLDSRLFSFAYSIPNEHLISGGYAKFILREAAKGVLNEGVRCERRKIGFNASISSLVDFSDQVTRSYLLSDSPVFEIIRKDKIAQLFAFGAEAGNSLSKFLFNFINAKIFLEAFIAPRSIDALL